MVKPKKCHLSHCDNPINKNDEKDETLSSMEKLICWYHRKHHRRLKKERERMTKGQKKAWAESREFEE